MSTKKRPRPSIVNEAESRLTKSDTTRRSEAGDTLIEVLLALMVLGIASVALILAFSTSISASAEHRNLSQNNDVLTTATEEITSAIQNDPSLFTAACTSTNAPTAMSNYPQYSQGYFNLPSPYTYPANPKYDVEYVSTNPVEWWNSTTYGTTCHDNEPHHWNSWYDAHEQFRGGANERQLRRYVWFVDRGPVGVPQRRNHRRRSDW